MPAGIGVQAAEQLGIHAGHAGRRFAETLAIGILADRQQDLADGSFDPRQIDRTGRIQGIRVVRWGSTRRHGVCFVSRL